MSNLINKVLLMISTLSLLASCSNSNGKIEYRKSNTGCLTIPYSLFRDPSGPVIMDTTLITYHEDSTRIMSSEDQNLKLLFEKREQLEKESKGAYLINTSTSYIISFTVKATSNDTFKTSSTQIYKTNPGEEVFIGCDSYINNNYKILKRNFEIVGERKNK
jgi:hypothetical protein